MKREAGRIVACPGKLALDIGERLAILLISNSANPSSAMRDPFTGLSDPTRRRILDLLRERPQTSGELAAQFDVAWPTISRHLAVLREAGLVTVERQGTTMLYELNMTVLDDMLKTVFGWTTPTAPKGRSRK